MVDHLQDSHQIKLKIFEVVTIENFLGNDILKLVLRSVTLYVGPFSTERPHSEWKNFQLSWRNVNDKFSSETVFQPFWLNILLIQWSRVKVPLFPFLFVVSITPALFRSSLLRLFSRGPSIFFRCTLLNSYPGVIIPLFQLGKFSSWNFSNACSNK